MSTRPELQIGVSRPPLPLEDLPTPEEVFRVPRIGARQMVTCVLGPSMIALGVSIGSGEWLLGPLAFGRFGFAGLGWLITLSAVLQTFYNVENARYTLATGEVPIVGFTRTPPGYLAWVPLTLLVIYVGWIWGGWASAAGQSPGPVPSVSRLRNTKRPTPTLPLRARAQPSIACVTGRSGRARAAS